MKSILIYGGTFDPPHLGHLQTALNIQQHFHFDEVYFLPCKTPLLKSHTGTTAKDRLNMLKLMLKPYPEFFISTVELDRETPSYMVETLKYFRANKGYDVSITILIGMDVLPALAQWYDYQSLPNLCNVLVIKRSGIENIQQIIPFREYCSQPLDLLKHSHGKLAYFDAGEYPISSSELRQKIHLKQDLGYALSEDVHNYIKLHGLYPK